MTSRSTPANLIVRLLIAALSLAVAVAAGLAFWQWSDPLHAPLIYPFSETYYNRAVAAQTPQDRIGWARQATLAAPARAENWVLLATAYHTADHGLSGRTLAALRQSYTASAFSPDVSEWRLQYIYANWSGMPDDLRQQASQETATCIMRGTCRSHLKAILPTLPDLEGRMALGVHLLAYSSQQRVEWLRVHPSPQR